MPVRDILCSTIKTQIYNPDVFFLFSHEPHPTIEYKRHTNIPQGETNETQGLWFELRTSCHIGTTAPGSFDYTFLFLAFWVSNF